MNALHLGVSGSTGRMGSEIYQLVRSLELIDGRRFEITCALSRHSEISLVASGAVDVDVWVDFSAPEAILRLLEVARKPIVIGTTGFNDAQMLAIRDYSRQFPVLLSANMSFGIEVLRRMIQSLPPVGRVDADLSIIEEHHRAKRDTPSGTAGFLAGELKKMGFSGVQIHSLREGAIIGVHKVRWVTDTEEIVLSHRALDRSIFAKGALYAASWLTSQPSGLYGIQDLWQIQDAREIK